MPTPTLCIFSPWNYPLFNDAVQTPFGGWEVRIALIARELARRGLFRVVMIVADHGQPHIEVREEITFYSWKGRQFWGVPLPPKNDNGPADSQRQFPYLEKAMEWLRALMSRNAVPLVNDKSSMESGRIGSYIIKPGVISLFDEVDADVYMVPGNSQLSSELAFFCRQRGKKYVFLAGSDMDYYPEYREHPEKSDIYQVPYSLKVYNIESADAHIVQNERQAEMLENAYGRSSYIVRNPIDLERKFPPNPQANTILWVGKSEERIKRPSLVLDMARALPRYSFVMIMTFSMPEVHRRCMEEAASMPNLRIIERVPFHEVERYFADARLHLNTSVLEGFPNTFLQAAKYGVPTLSVSVDPGEMLSRHGCGLTCGGRAEFLVDNARRMTEDSAEYEKKKNNCLRYVSAYHDKDIIIPMYEKAISSVLQ